MAWKGPAVAGAMLMGGVVVWKYFDMRTRIDELAYLMRGTPGAMHHQAGRRIQTIDASTMTELRGLQLVAELQYKVDAGDHLHLQIFVAATRARQPTQAPAAAEHEAGDGQAEPLERALLEFAAGALAEGQPDRLGPIEEAAEQEEGEAWSAFCSADPEGEDAFRDVEEEYHVVEEYM